MMDNDSKPLLNIFHWVIHHSFLSTLHNILTDAKVKLQNVYEIKIYTTPMQMLLFTVLITSLLVLLNITLQSCKECFKISESSFQKTLLLHEKHLSDL